MGAHVPHTVGSKSSIHPMLLDEEGRSLKNLLVQVEVDGLLAVRQDPHVEVRMLALERRSAWISSRC